MPKQESSSNSETTESFDHWLEFSPSMTSATTTTTRSTPTSSTTKPISVLATTATKSSLYSFSLLKFMQLLNKSLNITHYVYIFIIKLCDVFVILVYDRNLFFLNKHTCITQRSLHSMNGVHYRHRQGWFCHQISFRIEVSRYEIKWNCIKERHKVIDIKHNTEQFRLRPSPLQELDQREGIRKNCQGSDVYDRNLYTLNKRTLPVVKKKEYTIHI